MTLSSRSNPTPSSGLFGPEMRVLAHRKVVVPLPHLGGSLERAADCARLKICSRSGFGMRLKPNYFEHQPWRSYLEAMSNTREPWLSFIRNIWSEEWYGLSGRLRAHVTLDLLVLTFIFISGGLIHDFLNKSSWVTWMDIGYLPFGLLGLFCAVMSFRPPFSFPVTPDKVGKLSQRELKVWQALLARRLNTDGCLDTFAVREAYAPLQLPGAILGRSGREQLDKELLKTLQQLRYAGLLDDIRPHRYDDGVLVRPHADSQALLEEELERRERPAPLGHRSRPGALSA